MVLIFSYLSISLLQRNANGLFSHHFWGIFSMLFSSAVLVALMIWLLSYLKEPLDGRYLLNGLGSLFFMVFSLLAMNDYLYYERASSSDLLSLEDLSRDFDLQKEHTYFKIDKLNIKIEKVTMIHHVYTSSGGQGKSSRTHAKDLLILPLEADPSQAKIWLWQIEHAWAGPEKKINERNYVKFAETLEHLKTNQGPFYFERPRFEQGELSEDLRASQKALNLALGSVAPYADKVLFLSFIKSPEAIKNKALNVLFQVFLWFNLLYSLTWIGLGLYEKFLKN